MTYTYEFDPYQILGISSEATLEQIRDAYRQKTKRHHPDVGGEEWAFRLVVRAYEILSTARVVGRSTENGWRHVNEREWPQAGQDGWRGRGASAYASGQTMPPPPPSNHTWFWGAAGRRGEGPVTPPPPPQAAPPPPPSPPTPEPDPNEVFRNVFGHGDKDRARSGSAGSSAGGSSAEAEAPADPKAVFVEMLIIRFEIDTSLDLFLRTPEQRNLSCSLHVAWPVEALAPTAEEIPGAGHTLDAVSVAFKTASKGTHPASNQSQIEEGRFVGWLTYPTATQAADAYEVLRTQLSKQGLSVEKYVREMSIPRQWN